MNNILADYQLDAVNRLRNGSILMGGVGSGKTRTSLYYYLNKYKDKKLYIITTAKNRDDKSWEKEAQIFKLKNIVVDSWQRIMKYQDVQNSFFIFDEQRVVGSGVWAKTFIKIAKNNNWILLTATPGDVWLDYLPVFLANGFYKNKTEFLRRHVIFSRFSKFPKVERYVDEHILKEHRKSILIMMDNPEKNNRHIEFKIVDYDKDKYKKLHKERWNEFKNKPIKNASELAFLARRSVNENTNRVKETLTFYKKYKRIIVFYNFNYELDMLRQMCHKNKINFAEWNGHMHEDIPNKEQWIYLVQYSAGAEGWNCIKTNAILFFSLNHSYKINEQAQGRIDRKNTPYKDLYYCYLRTHSTIDLSILKALQRKKDFNASAYYKKYFRENN